MGQRCGTPFSRLEQPPPGVREPARPFSPSCWEQPHWTPAPASRSWCSHAGPRSAGHRCRCPAGRPHEARREPGSLLGGSPQEGWWPSPCHCPCLPYRPWHTQGCAISAFVASAPWAAPTSPACPCCGLRLPQLSSPPCFLGLCWDWFQASSVPGPSGFCVSRLGLTAQ